MTNNYIDTLRLEISVPVEGLPNIVKNPDGEKGTSGWETPLANQTINVFINNVGKRFLRFNSTVVGAQTATSSLLPATAGRYYAARYDIGIQGSNHRRARLEFFDSSRNLISSGTQTGLAFSIGTYYVPAVQAPTNTAFVRIRWDWYTSTGATPTTITTGYFGKVMITHAETNAGLGSVRTNLLKNPNIEVNTFSWDTRNGGDTTGSENISRTANGFNGTYALRNWRSDAGTGGSLGFQTALGHYVPVRKGGTYTSSVYARGTASKSGTQFIFWYDSNGTYLSNSLVSVSVTTSYTRLVQTATAPTNAAFAGVGVAVGSPNQNEYFYYDAFMLEEGSTAGPYFDGASTSTSEVTYAWTGTANQSSSTATTSGAAFDYSEPNDWLNIIGPSTSIKTEQSALDRGSLNVNIRDALLDPAVSDVIRPGKDIRLQVLSNGVWENRFEGRVSGAPTVYQKDKRVGAMLRTDISLTANDALTDLANQQEARGVATVDNLPGILEGKSVAYNCNNKNGQVANPAVVSKNEGATVIDQVAITRDSVLGYAWVDRFNVLNVYDAATMPTATKAAFTDANITDIDTEFNMAACINQVNVNWLRYNIGTGQTTTVPYGPWTDAQSQATWGPYSATFTIHGATENAANIAAYAQSILTKNATPKVRGNNLKFRVKTTETLGYAATLDLYDKVSVVFDTKINDTYRITSMTQEITPDAWDVTLGFEVVDSVAAPTVVPSPPFTGVSGPVVEDTGWVNIPLVSGYQRFNNLAEWQPMIRKIGNVVYTRGLVSNTSNSLPTGNQTWCTALPEQFRPTRDLYLPFVGNSATLTGRTVVAADGRFITAANGTSTYHSCLQTWLTD